MRPCFWLLGLGLAVAAAGCGVSAPPGACERTPERCDRDDVVVSPAWLADVGLASATVQVIDVRSESAYEEERIPGALHLPLSSLRETVDGVDGQVAPPDVGAQALSEAGVLRDAEVVVYGDATDTTAARVFWTLQYYGHEQVWVLDGGWGAWTDGGFPTSTEAPAQESSSYEIDAPAGTLRVEVDWVLDHLDDPSVNLVDARSAGEYEDGHIPGALSVNWTRTVADGAFRQRDTVAALYESLDPADTVVTYCYTGARASVAYLSLTWLGFEDVRVYDGSWAEWGSREDLPKETD